MSTNSRAGFPEYELEVQVRVLLNQRLVLDGVETDLMDFKAGLERTISDGRARVNVDVVPPEGKSEEFTGFVRRVQEQIRQAEGAVMFAYRTVRGVQGGEQEASAL